MQLQKKRPLLDFTQFYTINSFLLCRSPLINLVKNNHNLSINKNLYLKWQLLLLNYLFCYPLKNIESGYLEQNKILKI